MLQEVKMNRQITGKRPLAKTKVVNTKNSEQKLILKIAKQILAEHKFAFEVLGQ